MNFLHQLATVIQKRKHKNIPINTVIISALCLLEKLKIPGPAELESFQRLDSFLASALGDRQQYRDESVMVERLEPGECDLGYPRYVIQLVGDV
jgi:hypothetical protein